MAFDTFTPAPPQLGSKPSEDERIREFKAGEGCKKTFPDGLNAKFSTFAIQWNGLTLAEMTYILEFWASHGRSVPFWFHRHGDAAPKLWRFVSPLDWPGLGASQYSASINIEQAFDLG